MKEKGHLPSDFVEDVTPMEAGADSGVQAIIKQRVAMLNEIATNGLSTIVKHPEAVPIEIRMLCGLIQDICKVTSYRTVLTIYVGVTSFRSNNNPTCPTMGFAVY